MANFRIEIRQLLKHDVFNFIFKTNYYELLLDMDMLNGWLTTSHFLANADLVRYDVYQIKHLNNI